MMIDTLRYFAYNIGPHLATIFITLTYIPQIIKTYKTKNVDGISLWFWILLNLFLVCMWLNSLFSWRDHGNFGFFLTESINFILAIVIFSQIIYYRRLKRHSPTGFIDLNKIPKETR